MMPACPSLEIARQSERADLILERLALVRSIAQNIHRQLPSGVALEDLISAGILGLIAAVDNYDSRSGASLDTYAHYRVRGAVLDSIRGLNGIPSHRMEKVKQVRRATANAAQRLGREASAGEVAEEIGIPIEEYHRLRVETQAVVAESLDAFHDNGEDLVALIDTLADPVQPEADRLVERAELGQLLRQGMEVLPPMERTVIQLYYHEERGLREIAGMIHLHITRVSQLKTQATRRLRGYIEDHWSLPKEDKPGAVPGRARCSV